MPSNVPPELEDKFKSCKEQVMEQGFEEDAAYAICYTSVVEGKSRQDAFKAFYLGELDGVKVGARNSAADAERLQLIHDYAVENGAACHEKPEIEELAIMSADEVLVTAGGAIKSEAVDGGLKVGGLLVRFGSEKDPDISATCDFFTQDTDFDAEFPAKSSVYFNHGLDATLKRRKIATAELTRTDAGIWAETILKERDEYEAKLIELAKSGKLAWSSGTAAHLVERQAEGKAHRITRWPLGLDASLTHTPAEPRNVVMPLKSLLPVQQGPAGAEQSQTNQPKQTSEDTMPEITEEKLGELLKQAAKGALDEFAAAQPPIKSAGVAVAVTKDESENDFASAGEFFQAIKSAATPGGQLDVRLKSRKSEDGFTLAGVKAATGLNEAIPSQGGYLLQNGVAPGIIERMYSEGEILSRVARDQVGPNSNGMTYNALDETSRVDSSRWGGVLGYWLAEAGTKQSSKPKFRQMELKLKKVAALCYATDELLEDATALGGWLNRTVPNELRFQVEDAIINGNGAGKPLGVLHTANLSFVQVAKETGQAAATVVFQNLVKMWARMWAPSRRNSVWLINQDIEPQLYQMSLAVGTGGAPAYLPANGLSAAPYATLFGRPVVPVEHCQTLGTVGDIILADLSQYQLIEKGGVQTASSIHVNFIYDETAYRFVYRVDGQPIWSNVLTPAHGTNTLSPFVALATRS